MLDTLAKRLDGLGLTLEEDRAPDPDRGRPRQLVFKHGDWRLVAIDRDGFLQLDFRITVKREQLEKLGQNQAPGRPNPLFLMQWELLRGRTGWFPVYEGDPAPQNLRMIVLNQKLAWGAWDERAAQRFLDAVQELINVGNRVMMLLHTAGQLPGRTGSASGPAGPVDPEDPAFR